MKITLIANAVWVLLFIILVGYTTIPIPNDIYHLNCCSTQCGIDILLKYNVTTEKYYCGAQNLHFDTTSGYLSVLVCSFRGLWLALVIAMAMVPYHNLTSREKMHDVPVRIMTSNAIYAITFIGLLGVIVHFIAYQYHPPCNNDDLWHIVKTYAPGDYALWCSLYFAYGGLIALGILYVCFHNINAIIRLWRVTTTQLETIQKPPLYGMSDI